MTAENAERYPYFGVPPTKPPRPARTVPALRGKRVILSTPEGFVYDMRAVSAVYPDGHGQDVIDIVSEQDYFQWMFLERRPETQPFPARLVWVE